MLVGRRSRHVVLLIKVSVISRDPPPGRSHYAVSTMSMIESSAQASHWPSRISARSVARRYASHLANCPQAGPLTLQCSVGQADLAIGGDVRPFVLPK
jgi:hypothetical protein